MLKVNSRAIRILPNLHQSKIKREKVWWGGTVENWYVYGTTIDAKTKAWLVSRSFKRNYFSYVKRRSKTQKEDAC